MTDRIESSTILRRRLGEHLAKIKKLDPWPRERALTNSQFRPKLLKKYPAQCGYCLQSYKPTYKPKELETAHIIPLEIGGQTLEDNLILLCQCCHIHYDSGHLSINSMLKVADDWRKRVVPHKPRPLLGTSRPPEPAITPPPPSVRDTLELVFQRLLKREYPKAINLINERLADAGTTREGRIYLLIKRAELTRRRSGHEVMDLALHFLNDIKHKEEVPPKYRPYFFYELGYVHRLLGEHAEAARFMRLSAEASEPVEGSLPKVDYVAALVNETLCKMAAEETLNKQKAEGFERQLNKLKAIAMQDGAYWGGRWANTCSAHALQVRIRADDSDGSWRALEQLRNAYYHWDVSRGWDAAARQSISQLEGLVRVLFHRTNEELDSGIGLLARAFVTRLGNWQRPEGIRDVGFALATGLRKKGRTSMKRTADLLECLMSVTV